MARGGSPSGGHSSGFLSATKSPFCTIGCVCNYLIGLQFSPMFVSTTNARECPVAAAGGRRKQRARGSCPPIQRAQTANKTFDRFRRSRCQCQPSQEAARHGISNFRSPAQQASFARLENPPNLSHRINRVVLRSWTRHPRRRYRCSSAFTRRVIARWPTADSLISTTYSNRSLRKPRLQSM